MSLLLDLLSWLCIATGSIFCVIGAVGVLRFPDFYTRTHAASIVDTLGAGLVLVGLGFQSGFTLVTVKLAIIYVFILISSPTAAHALVKAAYAHGVRVELKEELIGSKNEEGRAEEESRVRSD